MLTELEYPIATTRSEQRGFQETKADSRRGRRQKTVSKDSYSSSLARIALQHKAELTWKRRNGVLSLDSTFPRRSSFSWQAMAANDPRGKGLPQHQMLCTGAVGGGRFFNEVCYPYSLSRCSILAKRDIDLQRPATEDQQFDPPQTCCLCTSNRTHCPVKRVNTDLTKRRNCSEIALEQEQQG